MKNFRILLAAVAGIVLASCSNDDFIGGSDVAQRNASNGEITFASGMGAITRADIVGDKAASLLGNNFIVLGVKGDGVPDNMTKVFDNYLVQYTANTAGTTESNTHNWEYAGITAVAPSSIKGTTQTIKYWDYSAARYDFAAFSTGASSMITAGEPTAGQVLVSAIEYNGANDNGFTLKGAAADLTKCYIADMVTVEKANYQETVKMKFRSMGTKVRMAIYETVPGYAIKDVKFYTDDTTPITTGASSTDATLIGANAFKTNGKYTVTYPTIGLSNKGNSDYNKAHVTLDASADPASNFGFGTLNYVAGEGSLPSGNNYLGRTLTNASYAGTSTYYQTVLPNEEGTSLELRIDYTLVSIDGSNEEINVHGAKAFVPATYTKWLPNYAYTYVFKISDNTNGVTNPSDLTHEGLYPITFDAVVVDSEEHTQSTITTVTLPSVTTYQKDHDPLADNEYVASKGDIYVQVSQDGTPKADLNTAGKSKLYTMSTLKSEAEVMDALNVQAYDSPDGTTIKGRNGLILTPATIANDITTIVGPDGNDITVAAGTAAKFTPAAGNYAYVYKVEDKADTDIFTAVSFDSKPGDWAPELYFEDPTGTTPASTFVANKTYYKKYVDLNTVYSVKVIKVQ